MTGEEKALCLKELMTIPGVGKEISEDLLKLGIKSVRNLKGKNPENLYQKLCRLEKKNVDRCMLYTLRCAVYYSSKEKHNPRLLKWWNWKDK
jgi:hypothetical protein